MAKIWLYLYVQEICTNLWPNENIITPASIDADLKVRINTLSHGLRRKLRFALDGIDILESAVVLAIDYVF